MLCFVLHNVVKSLYDGDFFEEAGANNGNEEDGDDEDEITKCTK